MNFLKLSVQCRKKAKLRRKNSRTNCQQNSNTVCPILNWCDNTSACRWINTRCKESLIGRALGRFFCGMIMGSALSLDADYISTHANC